MNRFRRSITAIAIAACLSVCSASVGQTTDAGTETTPPRIAAEFKRRGDHFFGEWQYEKAISDYDVALRLAPKDAAILLARGQARLANRQPDKAIADADAVIKIDAKHIDAYHLRGWARYAQGKPNEALKEFDRAVRIAPKNILCYWQRAELLVSMGRIDAAKKDFDAAVRLDPNDLMALSARGNFWLSRGEWDKGIKDLSALIRLDPSDVDTLVQRGWAYHSKGQRDKALADYGQAIRLRPKDPQLYADRADIYLRQKNIDYDKAIADLKAAIRLHPNDVGADYKPHAKVKLSPAALAHGQEQVWRMLKDRPNMARQVDENDVLWKWAARKFAGEDLGVMIDWDPLEPRHTLAQHSTPTDEYRGNIQTRLTHFEGPETGSRRAFEDLWGTVVFELHNIARSADFRKVSEEARQGKITQDAYVRRMFDIEHRVAQNTRAFFVHVYLPRARQKQSLSTDLVLWFCDRFDSVEQAFDRFTDRTRYPWRPYLNYYATLRVPTLAAEHKFDAAVALVETMLDNAEDNVERASIHRIKGRLQMEAGKTPQAIETLTRAVRLDPENVDVYLSRAAAYWANGQFDEAIEDGSRVIKIAPEDVEGYRARAYAYLTLGKTDEALADYNEVLRLEPKNALAFVERSAVWLSKGEFDKALADVNRAINIDPADDRHYFALTEVWRAMGKPKRAIVELKKLVDRDPKNVEALNGLAWTLATCPQAKCRDGKQAIKHARRACELTDWKFWGFLDTFAAASAEAGDFAAAVKWQTEAVKLAPDEPKKEKQEMRARLDLFKAKKPYREGPAKKTIPARSASK